MEESIRSDAYEERSKWGDMVEVFKMIQGIYKVNLGNIFGVDEDRKTRGYGFCLIVKRHVNLNTGLNFFSRRVINYWNKLLDVVVGCKSLDTFKMKLDEFDWET